MTDRILLFRLKSQLVPIIKMSFVPQSNQFICTLTVKNIVKLLVLHMIGADKDLATSLMRRLQHRAITTITE